jgi:hypothetical protein
LANSAVRHRFEFPSPNYIECPWFIVALLSSVMANSTVRHRFEFPSRCVLSIFHVIFVVFSFTYFTFLVVCQHLFDVEQDARIDEEANRIVRLPCCKNSCLLRYLGLVEGKELVGGILKSRAGMSREERKDDTRDQLITCIPSYKPSGRCVMNWKVLFFAVCCL